MNKIIAPESMTRTTLDEVFGGETALPNVGLYILTYMGRVVYVGKTAEDVANRLHQHYDNGVAERLGDWMRKVQADWCNVRLDVLEAPAVDSVGYWLKTAEAALIRQFRPLFNDQYNT